MIEAFFFGTLLFGYIAFKSLQICWRLLTGYYARPAEQRLREIQELRAQCREIREMSEAIQKEEESERPRSRGRRPKQQRHLRVVETVDTEPKLFDLDADDTGDDIDLG